MIFCVRKKKNCSKKLWAGLLVVFIFSIFFVVFLLFQKKEVLREVPPLDAPYRQVSLSREERVNDLLSFMTLEEKIGQMALVEKNSILKIEDIAEYGIGAILSGFGGNPEENTVEGWRTMVSGLVDASRESRLGIPIFYGVDAIHGHSNVPEATIFPHAIGLGATGDTQLVERVARATAEEMRATGVRWSFSPTLDMPKDIRWGRTYETFSDDPELVSRLGRAYVIGLQHGAGSEEIGTISVLSTLKHYIGIGSMMWGSSSNENFKIDQGTTYPDENALRREYLPPFKSAIDTGAQSVMVALNSWGNTKLSAHTYLVTDILKGELGFTGFVVSDWYGVYEISENDYRSAIIAINAGVDMVMLPFDYVSFVKNVTRAVKLGEIDEERIDDAARRILHAKFALGLFDEAIAPVRPSTVGSAEHRALAREAVARSLVLLKNENAILPIKKNVRSIQVAGSAADNVGRQVGAWTVEWQGIDGNWLPQSTSILEGIRARAGGSVDVEYDIAGNFAGRPQRADLGIAIVGEKPYAEGWGDIEYPILDAVDLKAIENLQRTCEKVVVILISGRPLFVTHEIPTWNAVVAAWLPGSEGMGVADVLFGDKPFVGSLPLPWPHHSEQLPITSDGKTHDHSPPLFSRYFGLH